MRGVIKTRRRAACASSDGSDGASSTCISAAMWCAPSKPGSRMAENEPR